MPLSDILSATGALALVIGLIVLLRFGTRFIAARRPRNGATPLWLAGQLALDGRRRLHLVQCGASQVLLLTGGASDVMLAWPPAASPAPGLEQLS
jgi:flagellar biogenesis protein FliO